MKLISRTGLAVLLATSALAANTAFAQETQPQKLEQNSTNSAKPLAPGQTKVEGQSAAEQAPGQQQKAGEVDAAADAAPGQVKKTDTEAAAGMKQDKPTSGDNAATDAAPGQQQKAGEATAKDAAPGQMQKTGEADAATDVAPGQVKTDQAAGEQPPSDETTASIDISAEQKTEIRTIIRETQVEPVQVDIDLRVGVAVPTTVEFHPLPPRFVEIVPQYRGYEYFLLADGRIIIVEPATHEVVYILIV
jgi:hypothetical protein